MKLIFFSFDLDPSLGQDILHHGAIEFSEFFVELSIKEEFLLESVDCSLLIAEWNRDLLLVKASDVVTEWLAATLQDAVEVSAEFI